MDKAMIERMSDTELAGAMKDLLATIKRADELDRYRGGDNGGRYRDDAALVRAEATRRGTTIERLMREEAMYGQAEKDMAASLTSQAGLSGGWPMLVASILSDAQEAIERGHSEMARQFLNEAKWALFHKVAGR